MLSPQSLGLSHAHRPVLLERLHGRLCTERGAEQFPAATRSTALERRCAGRLSGYGQVRAAGGSCLYSGRTNFMRPCSVRKPTTLSQMLACPARMHIVYLRMPCRATKGLALHDNSTARYSTVLHTTAAGSLSCASHSARTASRASRLSAAAEPGQSPHRSRPHHAPLHHRLESTQILILARSAGRML